MDAKDRALILALQADGRMSNQELSERINLSPSPCLRRLRQLENAGIIQGYSVLVDQKAYGLPVTAFVRIRLERHTHDVVNEFEAKIAKIDRVLDCYVMTGDADYLLRVVVESLEDYEQFVRRQLHLIAGVASIDTSFAYGHVKRAKVFPVIAG